MATAQELYEQALEAIDSGDVQRGIELLRQSLEEDSYNLDGWIKMAEVMPDGEVKYDVLEHILQLEPDNDFANREWDRLNSLADAGKLGVNRPAKQPMDDPMEDFMNELYDENDDYASAKSAKSAKARREKSSAKSAPRKTSPGLFGLNNEFRPGITNRDIVFVGGGLLLFTFVMCFISFSIITNANRRAATINAQETARFDSLTQTLDANATNIASTFQAATQVAAEATASQVALVSPTPVQRGGLVSATEIPPTPTEAPTVFTARVHPVPPESLTGNLLAWGGTNPASSRYLNLYRVNPATMEVVELNGEAVIMPSVTTIGSRIVYMRYRTDTNSTVMDMVSAEDPTNFVVLDLQFGAVSNLANPSLAASGNYLAFTGQALNSENQSVFLWDFVNETLTQLSNDGSNYRSVAVSTSGNRIVAVRENGSGTDLVLFNIDSETPDQPATETSLTDNGATVIEADVEISRDGLRILYSASSANGNADIMMMELETLEATPLITSDANETLPHYSPDNRYILYSANPTGTYNLFIMDTISGQIFQVTERTREPMYAAGWYN